MIYIIYKDTNYQDFGNKRIDIGHYYIEERNMTNPKDIALFGSKCCEEFLKKDVFFDDKIGDILSVQRETRTLLSHF